MFLAPPMAMSCYHLEGIAPPQVEIMEILKGALPFLGMVLVAMLIFYTFPGIALWLPRWMYG